ncbi:MAG TPA: hypothetical protein VJB57_16705 [Dehalococcoidia bacterium]|nr:hypothetical protein [Dehalococcoidia bacterium]
MASARLFSTDFKRVIWIPAAILLVAGLLVALFLLVYRPSHTGQEWQAQAWSYLGSEQFKIAAVSLSLPILVLFIETQFKVIQRVQENRQKQVDALVAEKSQRRLETVQETQQLLDDLFDAAIQVIFYTNRPADSSKERESVEDILQKLWRLAIRGESAVLQWGIRLDMPGEDVDLLLEYVNVILLACDGTARCLRDTQRTPESNAELQAALEVVIDYCKRICYTPILHVMDLTTQLHELPSAGVDQATAILRQGILAELDGRRSGLRDWKNWNATFTSQHQELLGSDDDPAVLAWRTGAKQAETWLSEEAGRIAEAYEQYDGLRALLAEVPPVIRYGQGGMTYSEAFIKVLADEMLFMSVTERLNNRRTAAV